jgi:hypothetical protein
MSKPIVPATALSRYYKAFQATSLVIGDQWVKASMYEKYDDPWYWFVVVNLQDLSVAANECSTSSTQVPTAIVPYQGKAGYFLFLMTNVVRGFNIPQGDLFAFIRSVGGGRQLERMEQMIEQLGTGMITQFSYLLAATTDTEDLPGFELSSTAENSILTMQFKPVEDTQGQFLSYAAVQV